MNELTLIVPGYDTWTSFESLEFVHKIKEK